MVQTNFIFSPQFFKKFMACSMTAPVVVKSSLSSFGRIKGTLAPNFCAMSAISSSSVETMISSNSFAFIAASMLYAIIGLPKNGLMFFLGILLLPPRAGIMAIVFSCIFYLMFLADYNLASKIL